MKPTDEMPDRADFEACCDQIMQAAKVIMQELPFLVSRQRERAALELMAQMLVIERELVRLEKILSSPEFKVTRQALNLYWKLVSLFREQKKNLGLLENT